MERAFTFFFIGIALTAVFLMILRPVLWALRNWKEFLQASMQALGIAAAMGAGIAFVLLAVFVVSLVGLSIYESYKAKQCQSVYERVAKARDAPDDYFGNKLRSDASAEQTHCDELAARLSQRETATGQTNLILSILSPK